jgi:hypothetical protein
MARTPKLTVDLNAHGNPDPILDPPDSIEQAGPDTQDEVQHQETVKATSEAKPEGERQAYQAPSISVSAPIDPPTFTVNDALEIAQTCALAGRTDLTAAFIEAQVAPSKVRARLLADKADRSPEIASRLAPTTGTSHESTSAAPDNLMVRVVQSRLSVR